MNEKGGITLEDEPVTGRSNLRSISYHQRQKPTMQASSGIKTGSDDALRPANSIVPIFLSMSSPIALPVSVEDVICLS
jgi:hypothetical protein